MSRGRKSRPLAERLWQRVDKDGPIHPVHGQCWIWKGWTAKEAEDQLVTLRALLEKERTLLAAQKAGGEPEAGR